MSYFIQIIRYLVIGLICMKFVLIFFIYVIRRFDGCCKELGVIGLLFFLLGISEFCCTDLYA
jgi:hypothetical protein